MTGTDKAPLLQVRNLRVNFGGFLAVDGVDLDVASGELLGLVGESGSGKSVSMLAVMGLLEAPNGSGKGAHPVTADVLRFDGHNLLELTPAQRRKLIGKDVAMVFQDALNSLNPSITVGDQVREVLRLHMGLRGAALEARVLQLFEQVEIPAPQTRLNAYPHQMSGGMNQRVMIAMAMACQPKLLIADEPTTALDVTIQAQVMALLLKLQREQGLSLVLITHDLAVVAQMAQRVAVMYAGQVVETAAVDTLFEHPQHPYTAALLAALPEHNQGATRLAALGGIVPGRFDRPQGCLFAPRCAQAQALAKAQAQPRCGAEQPALDTSQGHGVRCFYPLPAVASASAVNV
jgi:dipeptide transport system ATP-binding protein